MKQTIDATETGEAATVEPGAPYPDDSDLKVPPVDARRLRRDGVRGWHAGRGPGKEPLAAPGEFRTLWEARFRALEQLELELPDCGRSPDRLRRALLRAFDLGWRAGRTFEWERTGNSSKP
ncbi:MAG: hypothetical protein ACRDJN_04625 [Chloroflexota bacterium]